MYSCPNTTLTKQLLQLFHALIGLCQGVPQLFIKFTLSVHIIPSGKYSKSI